MFFKKRIYPKRKKFSNKTKELLLMMLWVLISLFVLMSFGFGLSLAYNWIMEVIFGPPSEGRVVIDLCIKGVSIIVFVYFFYKWLIKK